MADNKTEVEEKKKRTSYVYLVQKRKKDGKWEVKLRMGLKAIQLFDTQDLAVEFAKNLAETNGGSYMIRASKGEGAGKFRSK